MIWKIDSVCLTFDVFISDVEVAWENDFMFIMFYIYYAFLMCQIILILDIVFTCQMSDIWISFPAGEDWSKADPYLLHYALMFSLGGFNPSWSSDSICCRRPLSILVQVMVAWQLEAITWTNFDLLSMRSSDNHLTAISQEIPQPSITKISLEITYLKFYLTLPGANAMC